MDTPIDFPTSIGWKQWEGSIKKLSNELYDGSLNKMRMFIKNSNIGPQLQDGHQYVKLMAKAYLMNMEKYPLKKALTVIRNTTCLNQMEH